MNYEEKYKQALETVQEILSSGADAIRIKRLKLRLQSVFPELKESEDERIRKEIVDFITSSNKYGTNERCEAWLNWLEKQGKQTRFDYEHADIPQKDFAPIEPKTLNADEVIEWLNDNWWYSLHGAKIKEGQIEKFKKDFGLC